jgi:hypothetical protein
MSLKKEYTVRIKQCNNGFLLEKSLFLLFFFHNENFIKNGKLQWKMKAFSTLWGNFLRLTGFEWLGCMVWNSEVISQKLFPCQIPAIKKHSASIRKGFFRALLIFVLAGKLSIILILPIQNNFHSFHEKMLLKNYLKINFTFFP